MQITHNSDLRDQLDKVENQLNRIEDQLNKLLNPIRIEDTKPYREWYEEYARVKSRIGG